MIGWGVGTRVETGRSTVPGAFTISWIEVAPEHFPKLAATTEGIITELMGNEGYLGSCFVSTGIRHHTLSAWRSVEDAANALSSGAHKAAMLMAREGGLGEDARGLTSFWEPSRLNGVFHTTGTRPLDELGGQWL
jgi:hypothetical protein